MTALKKEKVNIAELLNTKKNYYQKMGSIDIEQKQKSFNQYNIIKKDLDSYRGKVKKLGRENIEIKEMSHGISIANQFKSNKELYEQIKDQETVFNRENNFNRSNE